MRAAVVGSILVIALAGCTAAPADPAPDPSGPEGVTFESLGIDGWPADADLLAEAPQAPAGVDAATYDQRIDAIADYAELAARDEQLRQLDDPLPELADRLQDPFARLVPFVAEQETSPRVSLLNYFGDGTEITAGPLMQHVWDVRPTDDGSGTAIRLQTWTAYEVTREGESGVIGVYREFYRIEAAEGSSGASWETAGVDTCALAVDDAMVLAVGEEQLELLEAFAREGDEHVFEVREVEDSIDEEFKNSCLDQG